MHGTIGQNEVLRLGLAALEGEVEANLTEFDWASCHGIRQTLEGSFSAVSKPNFASKYAFDSIFQALQDLHPFAPLQSQNFQIKKKNSNFREISAKTIANVAKFANFLSNFKNFSLRVW